MLSIFHRAYRFVNSMPEGKWVRLDVDILDEFRAALLHIPFAFSNLRAPLSSSLWATDATPVSGGATVAPLAGETAAFLYSRAETRGACLRLDGDHPAAMTERMIPIDDEVNKLVAALPWCVSASYTFRHTHHVNLQEARAVKREVRNFVSTEVRSPVRQLFVNDSQVTVAALAKGRSSSFKLNGVLRSMLPCLMVSGFVPSLIWIGTHHNPADGPSRLRCDELRPSLPRRAGRETI